MRLGTEDKFAVGAGCLVIFMWVIGMLLSLALTATIIWAIIHVVSAL